MKRFFPRWLGILLPLSLLCSSLQADTITLNSGEKVSGKVLSESDTEVILQVQISSSIKDERTIAKSEISNIEKAAEDSEAYNLIKGLRVNADHSYPAESYDQMLTTLGNFMQQYPLSEHLADATAQLSALQQEQARVKQGDLKFHGQWLTAAEAEQEKYEIEASQSLELLKTYGNRADFSSALNTFELIRTKYPGARAYPDAVDYTRNFVPGLLADAQRRSAALKVEQETFIQNMKFRQEPQRTQLIAAAQREQSNYTAMVAGSKAQWKPYVGRSNTSLALYIQQLPTLISSLASINTAPLREASALVAQARTAMEAQDLAAAQGALKKAAVLWPAGDEVKTATIEFNKLVEAAKIAAAATPIPTPTPTATAVATPAPTPVPPPPASAFFLSAKGGILAGAVVLLALIVILVAKKRRSPDEVE